MGDYEDYCGIRGPGRADGPRVNLRNLFLLMAMNEERLFLQVTVRKWQSCRIIIVARFTGVERAHGRAVRNELVDN